MDCKTIRCFRGLKKWGVFSRRSGYGDKSKMKLNVGQMEMEISGNCGKGGI